MPPNFMHGPSTSQTQPSQETVINVIPSVTPQTQT